MTKNIKAEIFLAKRIGYPLSKHLREFHNEATIFYMLTKFRMDFVFERTAFPYKEITEDDLKEFYKDRILLFKREDGGYFPYEDVKPIIRKKIRQKEYEEAVNELLCG